MFTVLRTYQVNPRGAPGHQIGPRVLAQNVTAAGRAKRPVLHGAANQLVRLDRTRGRQRLVVRVQRRGQPTPRQRGARRDDGRVFVGRLGQAEPLRGEAVVDEVGDVRRLIALEHGRAQGELQLSATDRDWNRIIKQISKRDIVEVGRYRV